MSNLSGVVREGWLKRVKNQKKRYFVLGFNKETGDAQLQYYENAKKYSSECPPKRVISLQQCLGITKKVDEKFGVILALYSKERIFRLKAETEDLLEDWYTALHKLHQMENKNMQESNYDLVWKVKVVSRGLGGIKNITGSYNLCLKENALYLINPVSNSIIIEEKLYHIRKFGYWDNCVFMEFGRATALGPGEIWMEVGDPLIAQKIEDSLSRSAKPKSRPERKSMTEERFNSLGQTSENNNKSPKTRRSTFIRDILKRKGETRPHSNSMSVTPVSSAEESIVFPNGSPARKIVNTVDEEESEDQHYPIMIPPDPSVPRTKSQSSGSFTEDGVFHRRTDTLNLESNTEKAKSEENNYSNITRSKRRSERKQDINVVRKNFVDQYTNSLPRRTSSSSSSSDRNWRRSIGNETFHTCNYDSDKDSCHGSDKEDGENEAFSRESGEQYIKMMPRQAPLLSDSSSVDEPGINDPSSSDPSSFDLGTYVPLKPPSNVPDVYVQMNKPGSSGEKPRNTSQRSSGSYQSPDEACAEQGSNVSSYVNMKPGLRLPTSSTSSEDNPGDESFDHLNRGENTTASDPYVNISPQSSAKLKKSRSQIQHNTDNNAYMNVDISRSKSVGSKTPRFRIVSEKRSNSMDDDESREFPRCYVNVKPQDAPSQVDANYANFIPQNCQQQNAESFPEKSRRELNYTSVDFSKASPPRGRHSPRRDQRSDNYSKIDFEKSHVLADISSTRERQLHHA